MEIVRIPCIDSFGDEDDNEWDILQEWMRVFHPNKVFTGYQAKLYGKKQYITINLKERKQ